jgi:hypothetical protein
MPFGFMHDDALLDKAFQGLDAPFGFAYGLIALCVGGGRASAPACWHRVACFARWFSAHGSL